MNIALPRLVTHQPNDTDARLDALYRDLTGTYTPAERRAMRAQERSTYNQNQADLAWWAGADSYIDFDGQRGSLWKGDAY